MQIKGQTVQLTNKYDKKKEKDPQHTTQIEHHEPH